MKGKRKRHLNSKRGRTPDTLNQEGGPRSYKGKGLHPKNSTKEVKRKPQRQEISKRTCIEKSGNNSDSQQRVRFPSISFGCASRRSGNNSDSQQRVRFLTPAEN